MANIQAHGSLQQMIFSFFLFLFFKYFFLTAAISYNRRINPNSAVTLLHHITLPGTPSDDYNEPGGKGFLLLYTFIIAHERSSFFYRFVGSTCEN